MARQSTPIIVIVLMTFVVDARHMLLQSSSTVDHIECTLANFQQCISGLWSNSDGISGDLAFPTTAQQLQLTCVDLKERVRCLDRHSERCFSQEMMQIFGHIVTNAKQFVHELCDDRKVQAEYLIHAECFRNISLDEHKCGQEYRDAIAMPNGMISMISSSHRQKRQMMKETIIRRSCCALQELVLCKRRHVREQCGQSASIFMRDHLPRITNPVLEQHCQAYTYGTASCDEALYQQQRDNNGHQQTYLIRPTLSNPSESSIFLQPHLKLKQRHQQQQQEKKALSSSAYCCYNYNDNYYRWRYNLLAITCIVFTFYLFVYNQQL